MTSNVLFHIFLSLMLSTFLFSPAAMAQANMGRELQDRSAAALNLLTQRQDTGTTTCPGGGLCTLGNICCGSGCMFSSSTCCGDPYFCYAGETCSAPNSVGDINCCVGGNCTPAKFVIAYANGDSGAGASSTGSSLASPRLISTSMAAQTSQASGFTVTPATGATSVMTGASPSSASKAAAAGLVKASIGLEVQVVILVAVFLRVM